MTIPTELMAAAIHQLLLAITFIIIPVVARKYGQRAQLAAEQLVAAQGIDRNLLLKNGIKFTESRLDMLFPFAIAALYTAVAVLLLADNSVGKTLTWIIEPLTLVAVGLVTSAQVFVIPFIKQTFRKSKDTELQKVNVERLVAAALKEFPSWLRPLQIVRFLAATLGSLIVLWLLVL